MKTKLLYLFLLAIVLSITLTTCSGGEDYYEVEEVFFEPSIVSLFPGDTENLTFSTKPYGSDVKNITLKSSNPGVATVDAQGTVTAIAVGSVIITASAKNGVTGTCNVIVNSNLPKQMFATIQFTSTTKVNFAFSGSGTMTIDWGDGTDVETFSLVRPGECGTGTCFHEHTYYGASTCSIKITAVNISSFYCSSANLISLDVSENSALQQLQCSSNKNLTNITFGSNLSLSHLECNYNSLTSLDVSKATSLINLFCSNNQLSELDLSKNINLEYIQCTDNQLTALDLSKNINLEMIQCQNNKLTELDFSKNINLGSIECQNNLFSAEAFNRLFRTLNDISAVYRYKGISIKGNPGTDSCDRSIAENRDWNVFSDI